jgi:hypothetical protein
MSGVPDFRMTNRNRKSETSDLRATSPAMTPVMGIGNESNQDKRAISTGKLNALPRLHTRPINVVVYHGS